MNFILEVLKLSIPVLIALLGWLVVHRLNSRRDLVNERRQLRTKYLIEAFRRLEAAAERGDKTSEDRRAIEDTMADIQLFSNSVQVQLAHNFMNAMASNSGGSVTEILESLRQDLRKELNLKPAKEGIKVFRFTDT